MGGELACGEISCTTASRPQQTSEQLPPHLAERPRSGCTSESRSDRRGREAEPAELADTGLTARGFGYRSGRSWPPEPEAASSCSHTRTSTRSLFTNRSRVLNAGQSMDVARDISLSISVIRPRHSQFPTSGATVARIDRRADRGSAHAGRPDWDINLGQRLIELLAEFGVFFCLSSPP